MIYLFILTITFINIFIKKSLIFDDKIEFSNHKSFVSNKKKPTTGGIYLLFFLLIFYRDFNYLGYICIILIFLIGFISDRIRNFSPVLRLIIQIFLTLLFILNSETYILDVGNNFINSILSNYPYISLIFTIFCFIVLINGTNFIDGVNLNTIGYYLIIYLIIYYLSLNNNLFLDLVFLKNIILFLTFLYFLNLFNKIQLGDTGTYILGFFSAFYVINLINLNNIISPFFAVILLWYPCFENLFSILRKKYQKKKISSPDNLHLHHNIFLFLKIRNIKNSNNITGLILNISNLILLLIAINYFSSSKYLILLILINLFLYIVFYNFLIKKNLFIKFKKK